ncbi:MAG: M18 family aminopeptidase [Lachnospiraceae bacterium]|nr:M18 family aminopeptidase [Lachnospiraceae bacterium]
MDYKEAAKNLINTISECVSPFHVVKHSAEVLKDADFKQLDLNNMWKLNSGGKYYVQVFDSSIVAFTIGEKENEDKNNNIRIATAHCDFPCLRIKPNSEIKESGYLKLNVEMYGGAILNTWLDRPLSIAGKVVLKSEDIFNPKVRLVDIERPVLTVPNLAIHINRDVNKGYELNKQKDMLPILDTIKDDVNEKGRLLKLIADEINVNPDDILDMELCAYQCEKGAVVGMDRTMVSSPRLDNITSVEACLYGITRAKRSKGINMIAMFDNEEVGSKSKQGAGSTILANILERIYLSLGYSREDYLTDSANGRIISADVAHCVHPNYVEKNDITSKATLNGGVVIKKDSTQKYANDAQGVAIVKGLCDNAGVKSQVFVNRSDGTGGSTLGSIVSTVLPMRTIDVGVPLLAMHSARELMGVKDQYYLNEMIRQLFS